VANRQFNVGGKIHMKRATINVPDNYPQDKLQEKIKLLEESLMQEVKSYSIPEKAVPSKWAKLVEEIDNDPDLDDPEFKKAWKNIRTLLSITSYKQKGRNQRT